MFRHCLKWDNGPKDDFEKYVIYEAKISQQLTLGHDFFSGKSDIVSSSMYSCQEKGACF